MTREQELQSMACRIAGLCPHDWNQTADESWNWYCKTCGMNWHNPESDNPHFPIDLNACADLVGKVYKGKRDWSIYFGIEGQVVLCILWEYPQDPEEEVEGEAPLSLGLKEAFCIAFLEALAQTPLGKEEE